jgi:hypothetical protein
MKHIVVVLGAALSLAGTFDRPLKSPPLTHELTMLMKQQNLDAFATTDPAAPDRFVAALFFQGAQLLLVAGRYPTPASIQQEIDRKQYGDVYRDLSVSSVADGKLFIHDVGADGLHAGAGSLDIMYEHAVDETIFDGNWSQHKMSEKEYSDRLVRGDAEYSRLLTLLIDGLMNRANQVAAPDAGRAAPVAESAR